MTLFSSLQITTTFHSLNPSSTILHKSLLPRFSPSISLTKKTRTTITTTTRASLLETPVLWVGRICIFYALLKTGFVGSPSNPLLSGLVYSFYHCSFTVVNFFLLVKFFVFSDLEISDGESNESGDLGFSKWTQSILGKPGMIYFMCNVRKLNLFHHVSSYSISD
jgi:hypothetical protein